MKHWMLALVVGSLALGCSDDAAPSLGVDSTFTKDQAAQADGLTSDGQDICEIMGWYTDGVCDEFCIKADESCPGETCQGGLTCSSKEYCNFTIESQCGTDGAAATCQERPENCTNNVEPVCGCDGKTYNTACDAAGAGVNISKNTSCDAECATSVDCSEGQECLAEKCVPNTCDDDVDCDEGSHCVDSVCVSQLPTTCNDATSCAQGYFCYMGSADACNVSGNGTCELVGQACPKNLAPVCGCDGITYGNACQAGAAGANIEADGPCPRACVDTDGCEDGEICQDSICVQGALRCGGRLGDTCAAGEFCSFSLLAGCGYADQTGVCAERPQVCTDDIAPVCGCDQTTYTNECEANTAGTSAYTIGACPMTCTTSRDCDTGQTCENNVCIPKVNICGGRSGGVCDALTEWCNYGGAANLCGQFDAQGTCDVRPQICTAQYDPVCGCDFQTYGNACEAHAAGVDIVSLGACAPTL